jgi:hypothetical protein
MGVEEKTQAEELPLAESADQIMESANDTVEEVLPIPEWGLSVKVRSFTAATQAAIKQKGFEFNETTGSASPNFAEIEIAQFQMSVVQPKFSEGKVRELHLTSGKGFARVIKWLTEHNELDEESLLKSEGSAEKPDESTEVST